jgi:23S rRNA pseudouridine1911/1915/1917 synthase
MSETPAKNALTSLTVLYEDNHCLAVDKPARILTIGDDSGDATLTEMVRAYIAKKYDKPGKVYLGIVHRLDGPVSGVVLFARTSKAAARLTEQFRRGSVRKVYHAIVEGKISPPEAVLTDWLLKNHVTNKVSRVSPGTRGGKVCSLSYRKLRSLGKLSLVEVRPTTGRSHQIRVQLASRGYAIYGDMKYGSKHTFEHAIALHAFELSFEHPVRKEPVTISAPYPATWKQLLGAR